MCHLRLIIRINTLLTLFGQNANVYGGDFLFKKGRSRLHMHYKLNRIRRPFHIQLREVGKVPVPVDCTVHVCNIAPHSLPLSNM